MSTAPTDDLKEILALRDALNSAIDSYVALTPEERSKKPKVNQVRQQISKASGKLASATAIPPQQATQLAFMPWVSAVVRTALELDLFAQIGESTTAAELAQKTGAEETLIVRLLRVLTGFNIVAELGEHTYGRTPVSQALTVPSIADLNKHIFDSSWGCIGKMPAYLKSLEYKNPADPENTLSHFATGTDFFAYLREDPGRLVRFNSAMKGAAGILLNPIPSPILEWATTSAKEDEVILVDVGGGIGQVTEKVMEDTPNARGRFVVQDLGKIVTEAKAKNPKYEVMEYDFFTKQPVSGAHIYFMRRVMHDFPDVKCREILRNQISAMWHQGKSKLLICETVLPVTNCSGFESLADISRATFCSMQRTEKQWRDLLESVGLIVKKVWRTADGPFPVIECELD